MKYSAALTSAMGEKDVEGECSITCLSAGINTTILMVKRRGNHKQLLIDGNLFSSCLALFDQVTALLYAVSSFLQWF